MLIRITRLLFLALFSNLLFACSGDEPEPQIIAEESQMAAKVDAQDWKSTQAVGLFKEGYLTITGKAQDGSHVVLAIKGDKTGTYTLETTPPANATSVNIAAYTPANASLTNTSYSSIQKTDGSVGGAVTISGWDAEAKLLTGSFDVRLSRPKFNDDGSSTNPPADELVALKGSFNKVSYTEQFVGPVNNTASAKIDGVNYLPTAVGGTKSFGKLVLSFTDNSNRTMALRLPENVATGTFDLGSFAFGEYAATYSPTVTSFFDSVNGGKVTITRHDKVNKRIEGSFNFNAAPYPLGGDTSYIITEGSFSITYL